MPASFLQITIAAAQPHDLRVVLVGRPKAGLRISAVLEIRILIHLIERRHKVVDGVECQGQRALDAGPGVRDPRPLTAAERDDVAQIGRAHV